MSDSPGLDYRFGSDDEDEYDYGEDFAPESPDGFEDDLCGTTEATAPTDDFSDSENLQSVSLSTDKAGTEGLPDNESELCSEGEPGVPQALGSNGVGSITDVEAMLVLQAAKRWSYYGEEAQAYEVVRECPTAATLRRRGSIFGRNKKYDDERILVVGKFRIWVFTRKGKKNKGVKELAEFHIFAVKTLDYDADQFRLRFTLRNGPNKLTSLDYTCSPNSALFPAFITSYRAITYGFPEDASPIVSTKALPPIQERDLTPYKKLEANYVGQCSYFRMPICHELLFYLKHLFDTNCRVIDFTSVPVIPPELKSSKKIEPVDPTQDTAAATAKIQYISLTAILGALQYDSFFRCLIISHLPPTTVKPLSRLIANNTTVTKLIATDMHIEDQDMSELFVFLMINKQTNIQILDLSGNVIGPVAAEKLSRFLTTTKRTMKELILRDCNMLPASVSQIFGALERNPVFSINIERIDLSNNRFDPAASESLNKWLEKMKEHSKLKHLIFQNCRVNVNFVTGLRYLAHLEELDLSGNKIDVPAMAAVTKFIESTGTLKTLVLNNCYLSRFTTVKSLLHALSKNAEGGHEIRLDMHFSDNPELQKGFPTDFNRTTGNIRSIDVSGLRMREGQFIEFLEVLAEIRNLERANLRAALIEKPKSTELIFRALYRLMDVGIRSLDLSDGYGIDIIVPLIQHRTDTCRIEDMNLSGNSLGNKGAAAIASFISSCYTLTSLNVDNNKLKTSGILVICSALSVNTTLKSLEMTEDLVKEYEITTPVNKKRLLQASFRANLSVFHNANRPDTDIGYWMTEALSYTDTPAPETDAELPEPPAKFASFSSPSEEEEKTTSASVKDSPEVCEGPLAAQTTEPGTGSLVTPKRTSSKTKILSKSLRSSKKGNKEEESSDDAVAKEAVVNEIKSPKKSHAKGHSKTGEVEGSSPDGDIKSTKKSRRLSAGDVKDEGRNDMDNSDEEDHSNAGGESEEDEITQSEEGAGDGEKKPEKKHKKKKKAKKEESGKDVGEEKKEEESQSEVKEDDQTDEMSEKKEKKKKHKHKKQESETPSEQ